jgi:predicted GNAT family acetyltransferase
MPLSDPSVPPVENDVTGSRFVIRTARGIAELTYSIAGSQIILKHTEVPKALQGSGLAGKLAHAALEHARSNNLRVIPICPYVIAYLTRHPEYQTLVTGKFEARHEPEDH